MSTEYKAKHARTIALQRISGHGCEVCGKTDPQKPMCFRGTPWCCELHRKVLYGEMTLEQAEAAAQGQIVRESDVMG